MNPQHTPEESISKTAKKRQMEELQDLGMQLTKLSQETLKKIGLPDELYQAICDYKKISSNGATKRQSQFIGRLMREANDVAHIRAYLAQLKGDNQAHNAFLQRVEQARTRLLEQEHYLTEFISQYPHANTSELHTLIRNARKEQEQNKPPKHFRALYQAIKTTMQNPPPQDPT